MNQEFLFPIILKEQESGVYIRFIGLDIPNKFYEDKSEAMIESKLMIAQKLLEMEKMNITIPKSIDVDLKGVDDKIIYLNIWMPFYRRDEEQYIKKTLTIPEWIDILARQKSINFSETLKKALLIELGLEEEVKKKKNYKFKKKMINIEDFIILSDKILKNRPELNLEFEKINFGQDTKNLNIISILYLIYLNKMLLNIFEKDEFFNSKRLEKEEWKEYTSKCRKEIDVHMKNISRYIVKSMNDIEGLDVFEEYLNQITNIILISTFKYDGIYARDESVVDFMIATVENKFMEEHVKQEYWPRYRSFKELINKHEIEIPYIYILVNYMKYMYHDENHNLFNDRMKKAYANRCRGAISNLSKTALQIILGEKIFSEKLDRRVIAAIKNEPIITQIGSIDLTTVLPSFAYQKQNIKEFINIRKKVVSTEVLTSLPMINVNVIDGNRVGMKYMIDSLSRDILGEK